MEKTFFSNKNFIILNWLLNVSRNEWINKWRWIVNSVWKYFKKMEFFFKNENFFIESGSFLLIIPCTLNSSAVRIGDVIAFNWLTSSSRRCSTPWNGRCSWGKSASILRSAAIMLPGWKCSSKRPSPHCVGSLNGVCFHGLLERCFCWSCLKVSQWRPGHSVSDKTLYLASTV